MERVLKTLIDYINQRFCNGEEIGISGIEIDFKNSIVWIILEFDTDRVKKLSRKLKGKIDETTGVIKFQEQEEEWKINFILI